MSNTPIFFIPGNCDPPELLSFEESKLSIFNLHGKVIRKSVLFAGVGGSTITPFSTWIEFAEEDIKKMLTEISFKVKEDSLIMLTHVPPYNSVDILHDGRPVGSFSLREFVEKHEPLAVFSGHVHESRGVAKIKRSLIINPGPAMQGYYAIAEISDSKIRVSLERVK